MTATWGTPRQQALLLREVRDGGRFGNGQAERGGAHAQDLTTRLRRAPDGALRLTGRKYYTTGSLTARWLGVAALDPDGEPALAFVRRDSPGIELGTDWDVMGQRATVSGSAAFADVEVATEIFSLSGASAADEKYNLSRHWRNARTHASHDPVSWKYHHIGNYLLNDALPPNHGQFLDS